MKRIWEEVGPPLAGVIALVLVWAIVAAVTDSRAIPSPAQVWDAFIAGMRDGSIPEATVKTLLRLFFAFALSIAVGVVIGVGMALNEFARRSIRPLIVALQITPFVAWLPIAVIWFGVTERAVVFVTVMGAFPSMTLATLSAMRQVPPIFKRAGRTMGADGWILYRDVIIPASMPGFMAGLQQAWGFAWKALMTAELIIAAVAATGLGHLLARDQADLPALLAVLGVIVVIGVAVDYLVFHRLDRRIRGRRGLLAEG
jgi:NitT/TauT family transport system permease protein